MVKFSVSTQMRMASSSDDAMPTPRSLGFDLTLRPCPSKDSKKLAVVCGWMGAKPSQLKPYVNFYLNRDFNVISYAVGPQHVFDPSSATAMMERVLDLVLRSDHKNNLAKPERIITHSFSVGGYLTGQLLRVLDEPARAQDREEWHRLVKGQVFDSPPDMPSIAKGMGASMGLGPFVAGAVEQIVKGYLWSVRNTAGKAHSASSAAFHNNHIPAPSHWMYSAADPVALEKDIDVVMSKWQAAGRRVTRTRWEHTPHIQHGRQDPERYFGSLGEFIDKLE